MTTPVAATFAPLTSLPEVLQRFGAKRVLLITTESGRHRAALLGVLADFEVTLFAGAKRHVPESVVADARAALTSSRADTLVTFGGGSATGLGKALRLEADPHFVAIPTTYAGSERTNIFGITSAGAKRTGRDARVRPDHVLYDVSLTLEMPKALTVTSLLNALAHPLGALESGSLQGDDEESAYRSISLIYAALEALLEAPSDREARARALSGAALAADALERGRPGAHHALAHQLGGRFDLDHSGLHSVLLPHSFARLRESAPLVADTVAQRLGVRDVESQLFDMLVRSGAKTTLRDLGVERAGMGELASALPSPLGAQVRAAFHGRRPSVDVRRVELGLTEPVSVRGPEPERARRVVVSLHGRGEAADAALARAVSLSGNDPELCVFAPQAESGAWYSGRYHEGRVALGSELAGSAEEVHRLLRALTSRVPVERIVLLGFSQGACLALEVFRSGELRPKTLIALSGAALGPGEEWAPLPALDETTRVLLAASEGDPWVELEHVEHTARALAMLGANVTLVREPGELHEPSFRARFSARALLRGEAPAPPQSGFGNFHSTEALPGALPRGQNSPRNAAYGLYAEQINGTSFVAPRRENQRSWTYRIRPAAQHGEFEPLAHPTLRSDFVSAPPDPDLAGFGPLPLPSEATDFVDGLATIGGAGDPSSRRGYALHVYALNRGMERRAFYDADGDLLILPELSALTLLTEFGVLVVSPGELVVVPRGVRFSVFPHEIAARGYVAEIFGRHFELPERGPVGANGLTDARHFSIPAAFHEDRLVPGFRVTAKFGGALYDAAQDYSPFDVVAWHGNYAPYSYNLSLFSPVNNTRVDHGDPSVYTVLSAPLEREGENCLDLVVFPPRWDPTENTFRPPFFHRNGTTEFNGIIREQSTQHPVFRPGGSFITPAMTPHGVVAANVERALADTNEHANRPFRTSDHALWFQFETTLPLRLSAWAKSAPHRVPDFGRLFRAYRTHFSVPPRA